MLEAETWYTESESDKLFAALFPNGFASEDVLAEIAPEGWSQSTLRFVFHPTVDQVHLEAVQTHESLKDWLGKATEHAKEPQPTRERIAAEYQERPIEVEREVRELVGKCVWDICSDEHD